MAPATAMEEWRRGWRVVLGAALASGLGIPLYYYCFSLFTLGMTREFGVSRGEMANFQALIVAGALAAPLIGRLLDRHGFARIFTICTLTIVACHLLMAGPITELWQFAAIAFVYGAAGIGCGPLVYTRPINAWFVKSRGLALGVCALGLALTALITPPLLARLIETEGWRSGYLALAGVSALVGLPLALWLVRDAPPGGVGRTRPDPAEPADRGHLRDRNFWLLAASLFCVAVPGAGLISQLSPLVQEEGIGPAIAALGVSGYAVGQVIGRLIAGWYLDRSNPRAVAFFFTFVPAVGFVLLAAMQLPSWAAILCVALVGVQQGAEIDLFAWFTARRFGIARYGTVYGWIVAASWVGNAAGVVAFGWLHDAANSYVIAEWISAALLMAGAVLIAMVRLPGRD